MMKYLTETCKIVFAEKFKFKLFMARCSVSLSYITIYLANISWKYKDKFTVSRTQASHLYVVICVWNVFHITNSKLSIYYFLSYWWAGDKMTFHFAPSLSKFCILEFNFKQFDQFLTFFMVITKISLKLLWGTLI